MTTDIEIVNEVYGWVGGRWIHGQAVKGVGADCIHFIAGVAKNLKWLPADFVIKPYARDWSLHNNRSILEEEIVKVADKVETEELKVGDVLLIRNGKCSGHAAINIGDGKMVHAHIRHGITVDNIDVYKDRILSVWRIRKQ